MACRQILVGSRQTVDTWQLRSSHSRRPLLSGGNQARCANELRKRTRATALKALQAAVAKPSTSISVGRNSIRIDLDTKRCAATWSAGIRCGSMRRSRAWPALGSAVFASRVCSTHAVNASMLLFGLVCARRRHQAVAKLAQHGFEHGGSLWRLFDPTGSGASWPAQSSSLWQPTQ